MPRHVGERITSIDPDVTSASKVDDSHNLKSDPYRIVSSDGVLFCVSKRMLIQR